ncbi:MAG: hypothetical protein ACE5JB_00595 [bacterium]
MAVLKYDGKIRSKYLIFVILLAILNKLQKQNNSKANLLVKIVCILIYENDQLHNLLAQLLMDTEILEEIARLGYLRLTEKAFGFWNDQYEYIY